MKVKTLNQKSKIALLAVILVALIGLVLSVGSIVHAQEVGQVDPRTSEVGQIDPKTSETEAGQPVDVNETAADTQAADSAQDINAAQPDDTNQQVTTHNDANSLLDSSNSTDFTNDEVYVYFMLDADSDKVKELPQDWGRTVVEDYIYYGKNVEVGTPYVSVFNEWSQKNFIDTVYFIGFESGKSNVLVQGESRITLRTTTLINKTLKITDNEGKIIPGASVTSGYLFNDKYTTLTDTVSGPDGTCKITFTGGYYDNWCVNVKADNYVSRVLGVSDFPDDPQEIVLDKINSSKHYLKLTTYSPGLRFDSNKGYLDDVDFDESLTVKIVDGGRWYGLQAQMGDIVAYPVVGSSLIGSGQNYFLEDANGGIKSLTLGDEVTITGDGYNLICLTTMKSQNQIFLKEGNVTYSIKHTLGNDTISEQSDLSTCPAIIDRNIDFTIEDNKLIGVCEKQNDVVTVEDRYEIIASPKDEYKFENWIINGTPANDDAVLSLTENQGAIIGVATSGGPEHLLTINYKYENGSQAADTYTKPVAEGETYSVESPTIEGYTPDIATVEGTMGTEDITTDVTYKANGGGGGGGDTPGGGDTSGGSDSAVTGGTGSTSTGDFNSSAVMAIMGLVALAGGFAITGRKKLFNK